MSLISLSSKIYSVFEEYWDQSNKSKVAKSLISLWKSLFYQLNVLPWAWIHLGSCYGAASIWGLEIKIYTELQDFNFLCICLCHRYCSFWCPILRLMKRTSLVALKTKAKCLAWQLKHARVITNLCVLKIALASLPPPSPSSPFYLVKEHFGSFCTRHSCFWLTGVGV